MHAPAPSPRPARALSVLGTGHSLPARIVTSAELDPVLGLAPGSVARISGVQQRHVADDTDTAASMGASAAHRALQAAGVGLHELDLIVCASATQDQGMPCNAALLQRELGLGQSGIPAMDINASCLGFIAALDTLSWAIQAGQYRRVLLVCADIASCGLDWQQVEVSGIFGDGAAAAVLCPGDGSGAIIASRLKTYAEGAELCQIPAGGSRFHPRRINQPFTPLTSFAMQGKGVFRLAARHLPELLDDLLKQAGLTLADIDWVIPHQASQQAMAHAAKRLSLCPDKVVDIFAHHGNQVAASLPTALDIAVRDGRISRGQKLMLIGTGAGLSLGGMIMVF